MSRPRRAALGFRVQHVRHPHAHQSHREGLRLIAAGFADLLIAEARREVAARLGVAPDSIDRESGELDDDALRALPSATLRGAA